MLPFPATDDDIARLTRAARDHALAVLDPAGQARWRDLVNADMERAFREARAALWWTDADASARTLALCEAALETVVRERAHLPDFDLPAAGDAERLALRMHDDLIHLGPLAVFWRWPGVEEVQCNGRVVFVRVDGELHHVDAPLFARDADVLELITGVVQRLGRTITPTQPELVTMLPDNSRLTVVIAPASPAFPSVTIRLHTLPEVRLADLIPDGTLTRGVAAFLRDCMRARLNVLITGAGSVGKTTLARATAAEYAAAPVLVRVITIEQFAELQLAHLLPNCVMLVTRDPNAEGRGATTIRDLIALALTMGPEVLLVGECRGAEALDLVQAMNTGHSGGVTTFHANSAPDGVPRFIGLCEQAPDHPPTDQLAAMIGNNVHLIVHVGRRPDNRRRGVLEIYEIIGVGDGRRVLGQHLWRFAGDRLRRTEIAPDKTLERMAARGVAVDRRAWEDDL